jgi:hypothetical protein
VADNKDIPQLRNPPSGDGHHVTYRFMTPSELAERDAWQDAYEAMLARQDEYLRKRQVVEVEQKPVQVGCVFAKSCNLPDAVINYSNPSGMVPTDSLQDYGEIAWLGAREVDDGGLLNLQTISGSTLSLGIGRLALGTPNIATPALSTLGAVGAKTLVGLVALFWTSSLGDSALYTKTNYVRSSRPALECACKSNNRLTAVSRATPSTPVKTMIGKWSMWCRSLCARAITSQTSVKASN